MTNMGDEWDAEDFEPTVTPNLLTTSNKWEGEDEDDNVKESWEDEEEEKKDEEKKDGAPVVVPKTKAKRLAEKIAQKERAKQKDEDVDEEENVVEMTPEQKAAEKLKRQRMQEEADLRVAMETFGVNDRPAGSLDSYNPNTKEEFDELSEALAAKISSFKEKNEYVEFVNGLVKSIVLHMPSADIRNLKSALENLYLEKSKLEKGDKAKKKGKGKAKLMVETDVTKQYSGYNDFDDYDDFM